MSTALHCDLLPRPAVASRAQRGAAATGPLSAVLAGLGTPINRQSSRAQGSIGWHRGQECAADFTEGGAGAPRRRPSVLRSSSTSGQWIPKPALLNCQFPRSLEDACRSRGYQTSGTVIVRPSARSTLSVSSVNRTSVTRSPALGAEVLTPCLQEAGCVFRDESLNAREFVRLEPEIVRQTHRLDPELRRRIVPINVDVRWFLGLMAEEVDPVRTVPENRWQCYLTSPSPTSRSRR